MTIVSCVDTGYVQWLLHEDYCGGLAYSSPLLEQMRNGYLHDTLGYLNIIDRCYMGVTCRAAPRVQKEEIEAMVHTILYFMFGHEGMAKQEHVANIESLHNAYAVINLHIVDGDVDMDFHELASNWKQKFRTYALIPGFALGLRTYSSMDSFRFECWSMQPNESLLFSLGYDVESGYAFACAGDYDDFVDQHHQITNEGPAGCRREKLAQQKIHFDMERKNVAFLGYLFNFENQTFRWLTYNTVGHVSFYFQLCNCSNL